MVKKLVPVLLLSAVAACTGPTQAVPDRGVASVNEPVLTRSNFMLDVAAPGGMLAPEEMARLDGWFAGLNLGYGDSIYVDGPYNETATAQVAQVAGKYGMMVLPAAPVTAGVIQPGTVRVIVSRNRAEVPNCPNWNAPASPNFDNHSMPNFGCAVNSNLAAMVANPEDLFHGREGTGVGDAMTASKAVQTYRNAEPTGAKGLKDLSSKKESN